MHVIKKTALGFLLILIIFMCGCTRVDTNPSPVFHQIRNDVSKLTGEEVYWDSSLENVIVPISFEEMIEQELTVERVVKIALLNNRNLQAVYENLGIAKAQLTQAGLLKNPIFSFSYQFSLQSSVTDLITGSLIQNFLEILLIPLKKRMAQAELEATKSMIVAQILDVIAETRIAFYTLQATKKIWDLKKQILLASELSYEAAQRLFEAGNVKDLDVSIQRSLYEQSKLEVASWEIAILEAREKLNVLMGLWGCQIDWKFSSALPEIPIQEGDFDNIENDAIINSVDLQMAYKDLESVAAGFGIDTSKLVFPKLDVGVGTERDEGVWYVGPAFNLAIPLFDFGKANSAKARAAILQKWNRYTALAIEIRSKARSSRFSLLNAFRQSQYLDKIIVPLSEQIMFYTTLQHNAMQIGVFQLLQTKQMEIEKKIQQVQKQKDYWIAKIELQTLLDGHILGENAFEMRVRKYYE